jgi:superfamily II DNA or RNA helicase/REP element-mobilizing transposase RayT
VFSEFFALQMTIAARRAGLAARAGEAHCGSGELLERFLRALPFDLTEAQARVLAEVRRDLASKHPMNRLLQGDVGSGKTVVAIGAMLLAVEAGFQAALMAPTQILAEQHYTVLCRWLEPLGLRIALRTGDRKEESGPLPLFDAAADLGSARCQRAVFGSLPNTSSGLTGASYGKRHLPHFERPWAKYAITFSTRDRRALTPAARDLVLESLLRWKDKRYALFAACVMPDHVHLLIEPAIERDDESGTPVFFRLTTILHSIKSYTANRVNKIEGRAGAVWEKESFDRLIRSESDLQEKFEYIIRNPWDAGVAGTAEDYQWVWHRGIRAGGGVAEEFAAGSRERHAGSVRSPERLQDDTPHIIIGTHALLYESVQFEKLGLVVIDEQHKFGVSQRAGLTAREPAPDVLVMTATPIPRTLTMTVYGDLDVSIIDEMPANRGKIITAVRGESKLGDVLTFMRAQLEEGRQAYVIYPLIDESEKLDVKAAAAEFELWVERLRPFRCELLHGRIPAPEKQAIMERFRRGETSALISTTVIEVGVDVPNATVMLIENAERFGLAQLHQLRGRIGRGEHKSYCILLSAENRPKRRRSSRSWKNEQRLRCGGGGLGSARAGRFAWDGTERAASVEARQSQDRHAANATRTRRRECDPRVGPEIGGAGESTFPLVSCRTRRADFLPRQLMKNLFKFLLFVAVLSAGISFLYDYRLKNGALNNNAAKPRPEKYTLASAPVLDPQSVSTLDALSRERRALVMSVIPSVVSIRTSKKVPMRRQMDPYEFFYRNSRPQYRNRNEEALVQSSLGSGVIVSAEGHIITNNHVVEQVDEIEVQMHDGKTRKARLVGADAQIDLAVLKIDDPGVKPLMFGDSDAVHAGDFVLAIGNPFGFEETVTDGIISSKGRPNRIDGFGDFMPDKCRDQSR